MKNRLRVWEKEALFLEQTGFVFEKKTSPCLGKTGSVFWDKLVRFGGKLVWVFWVGLGQSPSLTVLNAKHVWVWNYEFKTGCL